MYGLVRWLLFQLDPERAHELGLAYLKRVQASDAWQDRIARRYEISERLATPFLDHTLPGPLGVAAGFDKAGHAYNALLALGFSHVEVGTVTPLGQPGNPRPRMERYPDHHALVNRLGFNNPGTEVVAERLEKHPPRGLIGVNVGRNKGTAPEEAWTDYTSAAVSLAQPAGYVTINVSSPNTPGLRTMQEPRQVAWLVDQVLEALDRAGHPRPVLLKLHPDGPDEELVAVARAAVDAGAAGIIATNTTTARPDGLEAAGDGGLSGQPLRERANQVLSALYQAVGDQVPLIGVGGIETGEHALARIEAGASVLQAYTGFIYRGPRFARLVHQEILEGLDERGVDRLTERVGAAHA